MNQHEIITSNLRNVSNLHQTEVSRWLPTSRDKVHIMGSKIDPLVTFTKDGIDLGNTGELLQLPMTPNTQLTRTNTLGDVIKVLDTEVSLNHVGIGYEVDDIDIEVKRLTDLIKGMSRYHLYEDEVGRDESMRWLFIGDKDSDAPMCEIVLPEGELRMRPHMQFDVDTNLAPDVIEDRMSNAFGNSVLDWHLDIPEVGRVLSMGTYENRRIDLRVGIGSNLRSKKAHRESMVKIS